MADLGKTGKYPEGKLNKDDEGELRMGVAVHKGNVIIEFGTPVHWLGLPPFEARALGEMLIKKANEIEHG